MELSGVDHLTLNSLKISSNSKTITITGNPSLGSSLSLTLPDDIIPAGSVSAFAGTTAPDGWLECDGSAVSRTSYAKLFAVLVTTPNYQPVTFTVTIASPAVITTSGAHDFSGGERIRLSTTGSLPTGLSTTVDYFVLSDALTGTTFKISASPYGTEINTSGTQSGTHSYTQTLHGLGDGSTTFNVPDLRGEFLRGWDHSKNTDSGRQPGGYQRDAFQSHVHQIGPLFRDSSVADNDVPPRGSNGPVSGYTSTSAPLVDGSYGTPRISAETRPRNIAMMYIIKF